jgi:hypothetical protein
VACLDPTEQVIGERSALFVVSLSKSDWDPSVARIRQFTPSDGADGAGAQ